MKNSAIIKEDKLGIFVDTTKLKDGTDFTMVTIQKAKSWGNTDEFDDISLSLNELREILKKAEELK